MIWRYFLLLLELEGEEGETKLESKTSDTMTWRKHGLIHLYCHFYYFSKVLWAVIWIFYPWMCALNWAIFTWTYTHALTVTFCWPFRKPSASRMTLDYLILNLIKILGFNSSVEIMLTHTHTQILHTTFRQLWIEFIYEMHWLWWLPAVLLVTICYNNIIRNPRSLLLQDRHMYIYMSA